MSKDETIDCHSNQHDYWVIEMARRGYVVVNADWAANGESEIMSNGGYLVVLLVSLFPKVSNFISYNRPFYFSFHF